MAEDDGLNFDFEEQLDAQPDAAAAVADKV